MTGIVGGSGGGGGYNYVQNPEPADPEEGEEWYDTGANQAFVYDGAAWIELTVTSHGALSDLSNDDHPQYATDTKVDNHAADVDAHHTRYTDTEARGAVTSLTPVRHRDSNSWADNTSGTFGSYSVNNGVILGARIYANDNGGQAEVAGVRLRITYSDASERTWNVEGYEGSSNAQRLGTADLHADTEGIVATAVDFEWYTDNGGAGNGSASVTYLEEV